MQLVGRKDEIKNLEWDLQKSEPRGLRRVRSPTMPNPGRGM